MMKRMLPRFVFILLLAVGVARAEPRAVDSPWQYRWGDSPLDASGHPQWTRDDAGWQEVAPFATPPGRSGETMLWLKLTLPEGNWRDPTLHLGDVFNALEIWTDEDRLATLGLVRPDASERPAGFGQHLVRLEPWHLGKPIYLRLQASDGSTPSLTRFAEVGERGPLVERMARHGAPLTMLAGFLIGLALLAFVGTLGRQQVPVLTAFGVFHLCAGLLTLTLAEGHELIHADLTVWYRLSLLGGLGVVWSLGLFVDAALGEGKRPWFRRLLMVVGAASIVITGIGVVSLDALQLLQTVLLLLMVVALLPSAVVVAAEARAGNRDAWTLLVGVLTVVLVALVDVLPMLGIGQVGAFLVPWSLLALTLSFAVITARRFVRIYTRLRATSEALDQEHARHRAVAGLLTDNAGALVEAVEALRTSGERQRDGLASQAVALQQTQVTAEEIRQLSAKAAARAHAVRALTDEMGTLIEAGRTAMDATRTTLDAIREETTGVARRVDGLGTRLQEMATVVETMRDIAARSNMLALNAAVEAVRSGAHGKGFGVVAREMRALADQSMQATRSIQTLIDTVSDEANQTMALSSGGARRVEAGVGLIQASQDELHKLTTAADDATRQVADIAVAIDQQHAGISQLTLAIRELHQQMEETIETLTRAETAAGSVAEVAGRMNAFG